MNDNLQIETQELFQNLQISQKIAEELLLLLSKENEALQKMDVRSLTSITKQKETLIVKIHYLDNRIAETVGQALPGKKAKKLAELSPMLSKEKATTLLQYSKNLNRLRQEVQIKNLINKRVTSDTLTFINDAISIFTAQPEKNQLYGNRGMTRYSNKTPTMISREV